MLRKFFIALSACLFSVIMVCAQGKISYNMEKAYEALGNEDYAEAEKYFTLEIYENPNNGYAWTLLSILKYDSGDYKASFNAANNAIKYLSKGDEKYIAIGYSVMASCNLKFGEYKNALKYINQAIELETSSSENLVTKANILYEMGKSSEAISQLGDYINKEPDNFYGYYRRGFFKDNVGDIYGAIEDYTAAIALNPEYAYSYLGRGNMYNLIKQDSLSRRDFEKVIHLDLIPSSNSCAQYAFFALGHKKEAIHFMNKIIEYDIDNAGNYYDATCLYSLMGEYQKAIEMFEICLEKGYRRFSHIDNDDDLDNIRSMPEFIELYNRYKNK